MQASMCGALWIIASNSYVYLSIIKPSQLDAGLLFLTSQVQSFSDH